MRFQIALILLVAVAGCANAQGRFGGVFGNVRNMFSRNAPTTPPPPPPGLGERIAIQLSSMTGGMWENTMRTTGQLVDAIPRDISNLASVIVQFKKAELDTVVRSLVAVQQGLERMLGIVGAVFEENIVNTGSNLMKNMFEVVYQIGSNVYELIFKNGMQMGHILPNVWKVMKSFPGAILGDLAKIVPGLSGMINAFNGLSALGDIGSLAGGQFGQLLQGGLTGGLGGGLGLGLGAGVGGAGQLAGGLGLGGAGQTLLNGGSVTDVTGQLGGAAGGTVGRQLGQMSGVPMGGFVGEQAGRALGKQIGNGNMASGMGSLAGMGARTLMG